MSPSLHHPISIIFFNTASRPALISLFLSNSVKKLPGILGAHGYCSWGVMGLGYFFLFFFSFGGGGAPGGIKSVDQSTNERTIPILFSYISPFVCSYSLPGIILMIS